MSKRTVVIVGGGRVAARKARGLIQAGAQRVRVVSPDFHPDLPAMVERVQEAYADKHLEGGGLVFAATGDAAVNDAVVRDARRRGLLVSRADSDDDDTGDFTTPAMIRRGRVSITVSAGSPALAARIRDTLEETFDPRWERMADAMLVLRPQIRAAPGLSAARRAEIFRDLASSTALAQASEGAAHLFEWLSQRYPELKNA